MITPTHKNYSLCQIKQFIQFGQNQLLRWKPFVWSKFGIWKFGISIANVTLKIKLRSSKFNQLFPSSQKCNLCKLGQNPFTGSEDNALKQSYTDAGTNADGIHTKTNMSPLDWGWGGHKHKFAYIYSEKQLKDIWIQSHL